LIIGILVLLALAVDQPRIAHGAASMPSTTATSVYGQGASGTSFATNSPGTSATSMNLPTEVAAAGRGGIYVADELNNRVLYFPYGASTSQANAAASVVYGQGASGTSFTTNSSGASTTSMNLPTGAAVDGSGGLYVADAYNNRVLYFPYDASTGRASTTASIVYGQGASGTSFTTNSSGTSSTRLYGPTGVAVEGSGGLYVAEIGGTVGGMPGALWPWMAAVASTSQTSRTTGRSIMLPRYPPPILRPAR
jgi:sugar lactone lactonase YvrE